MPDSVSAKKLGDGDGIMATLIYPGGPEVRVQGGWFAPGTPLKMTFQATAERGQMEFLSTGLFVSDYDGNSAPRSNPADPMAIKPKWRISSNAADECGTAAVYSPSIGAGRESGSTNERKQIA